MINFLKNNYLWISAIIIPLIIAIINILPLFLKKSDHNQKIHDINGNNNIIINGDHKNRTK